jgi:hypothetical protein
MPFFRPATLLAALLSLQLGLALPSQAADSDQVALSEKSVETFLAAHGELEALARAFAVQYGDRSDAEGDDPVAALPAFQDVPQAREKTMQVLSSHGFVDLDEWERVTNSVLLAYQYVDPADAPPDAEAEKAKARAEIEKDPSLSPEKKTAALAQLESEYATLLDYAPLPGNVEAVRPFAARIKPIAEEN